MKAPRPHKNEPDVVDRIVEDLSQQDVMPADGGSAATPESDTMLEAEEQAGRWDEPVGGVGHQAPRAPLEDETKAAEVLVQRGVTEAEEEIEELEEDEASPDEAA